MSRRIAVALMSLSATAALGLGAAPAQAAGTTCTAEADGGVLTPEQNVIVGKVTRTDYGLFQAACVNPAPSNYSATFTMRMEAYRAGTWVDVCSFGSVTSNSSLGTVVFGPSFKTCTFPDMTGGEIHRTVLTVATTDGVGVTAYSAPFGSRPG